MKPIEIHCLHLTPEQVELQKLDLKIKATELHTRPVTFYTIANITPYTREDGEDWSAIDSGSMDFVVPMSYNNLKKLIDNHLQD